MRTHPKRQKLNEIEHRKITVVDPPIPKFNIETIRFRDPFNIEQIVADNPQFSYTVVGKQPRMITPHGTIIIISTKCIQITQNRDLDTLKKLEKIACAMVNKGVNKGKRDLNNLFKDLGLE